MGGRRTGGCGQSVWYELSCRGSGWGLGAVLGLGAGEWGPSLAPGGRFRPLHAPLPLPGHRDLRHPPPQSPYPSPDISLPLNYWEVKGQNK